MAIPEINELFEKYKKKGFIALGINSKDSLSNKSLEQFIERKIKYPLLFVNSFVDSIYQIKAYPTFYLIDNKGKIIYRDFGFYKQGFKTLDSIINSHLIKNKKRK